MTPFELIKADIDHGKYTTTLPHKDPEYKADVRFRERMFRSDTERAYGMTRNPKAERVWRKAWEDGHSEGLNHVLQCYDELAELVL